MQPAQIAEVMDIERASFRSPWSREVLLHELEVPHARVEVLKDGPAGPILAVANYWLVADELHLLNIATHPQRRRQGHAGRMLAHVLEVARRQACRAVTLEVRRSNEAARALYRKHGFAEVGVRAGYYQDENEDAILMTFELIA